MPVTVVALTLAAGMAATVRAGSGLDFLTFLPNNFPHLNPSGFSTTFSPRGFVDLAGEYFQPQGSNGRACSTCHTPQDAWSINPATIGLVFARTGGTHPLFNPLDANNPEADLSTVAARRAGYSMMLTRGVFRRGGAPRVQREWDVIAVDDPHGFATAARIVQWRRPMPTINFHLGSATVAWDDGNSVGTDQVAGLTNQATRNVTGAQQGQPAPPEVIAEIAAGTHHSRRRRSNREMFDCSSVRSSTSSRPSREISKSTSKSAPRFVSGRSCLVSTSTSHRFLCWISPRSTTRA